MAKKKKVSNPTESVWSEVRDETIQAVMAIFSFLVTLLSLLAAFNKAGVVGEYVYIFLVRMFGVGYFLIPIVFTFLSIAFVRGMKKRFENSKAIGALVFFISGLGLIHIISTNSGGIVGRWIAFPLLRIMDVWATSVLLIALIIVSIFILFEARMMIPRLSWFTRTEDEDAETEKPDGKMDDAEEALVDKAVAIQAAAVVQPPKEKPDRSKTLKFTDAEEKVFASAVTVPHMKPFTPPPLTLLEKDRGKAETGDIKANANIIKRTLQNFNITVEMDEVSIGPSVTRYALKPAEGVKLSKIITLNNDLALALAAHPIRIEAPIPGKSLVGIEVPNTAKTTVGLATLLSSSNYQGSDKPLLMSLGKDITGQAHFSNLAKAPHMLIAGATGSGKSVTIHALITSLLYRNSPENLKFIMIDPKRVELTLYNKTPHLLTPVITDAKKAILALKWAAKEMSRRYDLLEQNSCRDIDSYHKNILAPAIASFKAAGSPEDDASKLPETMPYIVVIIDELADIMQTYPRELESAIVRLAQMSRAVGIHLVLSTQRPSVNVITGLIKANVPTRVALQVASQIDSRTILDQQGAEKLLGAGDMLYMGAEMSKPVRLQSAYISESEVKRVVKYLVDEYRDEVMGEISFTSPEAGAGAAFESMMESDSLEEEDELYEAAREAVVTANKASTSYIQRKLGVGYSRAAKLMDLLEQKGVIGAANGSKPREIIGVGAGMEQSGASSSVPDTSIEEGI
ncbi:MAG: DNA translocase FtsK 4TM domain-containing protein [Patescibacteria group bacterium]